MNLDSWAAVATIVQAVFLPISLFLVWSQLRQQSRLTKAANTQALVELSSPFNLQLIQDRNFAQFWVQGASLFEGMDEVERYRFRSLLIWWLIFHENIFYQRQKRLIDEPTYSSWNEDLKNFVDRMNLAEHWPGLRGSFQKGFAEHVGKLVDSSRRVEH